MHGLKQPIQHLQFRTIIGIMNDNTTSSSIVRDPGSLLIQRAGNQRRLIYPELSTSHVGMTL